MTHSLTELANRLARVQRHLRKWAKRTGTSCYRLYEKDLADQPLIVDWYDGHALCWAFARTRNESEADEARWLDEVRAAIRTGLGIDDQHLFLKRRGRQEDRQHGGQYQVLARQGVVKVVGEGPLRFEVNLSDYLDTGLFLDHRPLRARVREQAQGQDVLNLFCYTGAFSCHAAAGGARTTTSVDLSNTYLEWAGRNLALNGIAAGDRHRLLKADTQAFLRAERALGRRYGIIVCDPPTFSNSTAMQHDFAVQRDHPQLIAACLALLAPGGTLWFSTNCRGFDLAPDAIPPGARAIEASAWTVPEDFRNRRIHRCWLITS